MKTTFWRGGILSVALAAVGLGLSEPPKPADPGKPEPGPPAQAAPSQPEAKEAPAAQAPSVAPAAPAQPASGTESATAPTNPPAPRLVQPVAPPADLKLSPGLQELIKMVQAGVSEEVLLAFITNSTNVFDAGADQIVYLNDLGVSSAVITALIQHDASPETQARRQAAVAAAPLPENIKLKTPATNVYPPTVSISAPTGDQVPGNYSGAQPVTPPPEPTPVGDQAATSTPIVTNVVQVTNVVYFYDALAPYGNWVSVPEYGLCWQPTVAVINVGWRPYCDNGRWIWTPAGWYWYSYYSWGWAPFHYGRWFIYPGYGWLWWPDLCWGPSWVTWRYTPYYCGWAPLPPHCTYVSGFGLYYRGSSVGFGFGFGFDWDYYTFIPITHFCHPNPHHYYVPRHQAKTIYKDSVVINNYIHGDNNTIINEGIGLDRVAKIHRGEVPKAEIRTVGHWRPDNPRPERLERHDSGLAVVRPALPTRPPGNPTALIERTSASSSTARPIRPARPEPASAAMAATSLAPSGSAGSTESAPPRPTPMRGPADSVRPQRPANAAAVPSEPASPAALRPARPQPLPESARPSTVTQPSPSGSVKPAGVAEPERPVGAAGSGSSATRPPQAAPSPGPTTPTPGQAAPAQGTRPSRPAIIIRGSEANRPAAPGASASPASASPGSAAAAAAPSSAKPVPSPTPVRPSQPEGRTVVAQPPSPTRPSASGSAVAVPGFTRPSRPSAPVPSAGPSIARVPEPRAVPGGSFYAGNPVVSPPSIGSLQPPAAVVPSAPARPVAPSIAPTPSIGSRPSSVPSFSAPSRPAPSPSPAPSRSIGGGVSRPSRPGRD